MSALHSPTQTLPTGPAMQRMRQVIDLLDTTSRRMTHVTKHLDLCEHAPTWPAEPIANAAAAVAFRAATVEAIKFGRQHRCPDCNTGRVRALLRLSLLSLDLWQEGKHYVQNPEVYPLTLVRRAERLLHDTAEWVLTGDPRHLLR